MLRRDILRNDMFKNKNRIILLLISLLFLNFIFTSPSFAREFGDHTGDEGEKPNILIRVLTWGFRFVNRLMYDLLDNEGLSIDSLVYKNSANEGKGEFIGLTLFKPGDAQNFIATFYNIFLYIAMAMFVPIFYWIGVHFANAGDNPQEKSLLKDKLMRIIMTFIFIYSMPELLVALVKVSDAFTGIFASAGARFLNAENTTEIVGAYIEGNEGSIIETVTGLMLIGINLWIIVFYIIRDLTIAFLFMLFPIIAIWYPMNKGMVKNWWKEMAGNILAQPIQAMILTMVLALGSTLGMGGAKSLGSGLYTLVAFGSIIPMTSIVKGFLGLETGIGAGRSMAGMGALFGAMRLANMTKRGMENQASKIKDGATTLADNKIKETEIEKNIEPGSTKMGASSSDVNVTLGNSNASAVDNILNSEGAKDEALDNLKRENRVAKKQLARGIGGAMTGTFAGITGATMMAGVGAKESIAMGSAGFALGRSVGDKGTGLAYSGIDAINQHGIIDDEIAYIQENIMSEDVLGVRERQIEELQNSADFNRLSSAEQAEQIQSLRNNSDFSRNQMLDMKKSFPETYNTYREKAQNRYLGLENDKLDGTEYQVQERQALMAQKRWEATGTGGIANFMAGKSYTDLTPARKTMQELKAIDNAHLYQDADKSVVYTKDIDGGVGDILHVGDGHGNYDLLTPIEHSVAYTTEEIEIPQSAMYKIDGQVARETESYMKQAYPHLEERDNEYRKIYSQRERYNRDLYTNQYKNEIRDLRGKLGTGNLNFQNNDRVLNEELIRRQEEELDKARKEVARKTYVEDKNYANDVIPNLDSLQ